jgi:hypothetical protein
MPSAARFLGVPRTDSERPLFLTLRWGGFGFGPRMAYNECMVQSRAPKSVPPKLVAQTGMHVVIELTDTSGVSEHLEVDIVPDELADLGKGFLGEGTPLAKAICGRQAGRTIPYHQADIVSVHILSISPSHASPDADIAQQREAAVRKAVEEAQRTDAIVFASSFSGKWGDYDPQGMEHWDKSEE